MPRTQNEDKLLYFLNSIIIPHKTAIIGLGNELRCDDAFGVLVVNVLKRLVGGKAGNCVKLINAATSPEAYFEAIRESERIILLDAVRVGEPGPTGDLLVLEIEDLENMEGILTTHSVSMVRILDLRRQKVYLIGAYPACLDYDVRISRGTAEAMSIAIRALYKVIISKCNVIK